MRNRTLAFKSYTPNDENLKQHVNIATPNDVGETVESETKNFTKDALAEAAVKEKEEVVWINWLCKESMHLTQICNLRICSIYNPKNPTGTLNGMSRKSWNDWIDVLKRQYWNLFVSMIRVDDGTNLLNYDIGQRLSNETDKTAHLAEAVANAEKQQQLEKDD